MGIKSGVKFARETDLGYLRGAAEALQNENKRLLAERTALLAELAGRDEEIAGQREKITRLEQEKHLLQEQVDLWKQKVFGQKSERRVPEAGEDAGGGEAGEEAPKPPRKKRKKHGRTAQPGIAARDVVYTLVGDELKCKHCDGELTAMGTEAEEAELVAIEERRIYLERSLRTKYTCRCCRIGVTTAPGPVKLLPGGRYALSFAVAVAKDKYFMHLPLDRQVRMMKHEGLVVTTATLFDQVDALATTLRATYDAIWKIVQAEPVLRADETPWAVLSNGHTENERFYAWVAVGAVFVVYRMLDTRSAEGAANLLGDFSGTLMVDGLTSYPAAAKTEPGKAPRFKIANCMAHARRKFIECEKYAPKESAFAIDRFRKLYDVEREGKGLGNDLLALRQARSKPLLDELFAWAREQQARPDVLAGSGLARALGYLVNHEAGLRVYLDDPAVPIDNNLAEQAERTPVLGRKNHYGSRSRRGTETAAILYTLTECAHRVGVNPMAYLEAAAETALRQAGAVLLPDEFKRQLEALRQPP